MISKRLDELISHKYKKVYVSDANSIHKGLAHGLYSKKNLKKGEIVFIAKGRRFRDKVDTIKKSIAHRNAIGIKPGEWIDPRRDNPLRYLNHSCNPNLGIRGSVLFVALRDIRKGEHLTVDYSITESDMLWDFKIQTGGYCKCGANNCRKIIRSIQFLPQKVYKKYLPYIPSAFQKEYQKYHSSESKHEKSNSRE